ncbi:hypothetical protein PIB30_040525 [Stylosanthes scabra]|uniref:Zinc finger GRF-type domain-containing protein n=1 Tax=Stylosanthes scabra TaxID=79078 RepID=A0ABU6SEU0_9FABA|nr:hypothetical protein [Stylosanthes scabra]
MSQAKSTLSSSALVSNKLKENKCCAKVVEFMESDGAATSSRRSERSSSTQGVYMPSPGEEMDGVAPKCLCGVYAILYLSKTSSNPNRLFFGCPFFKVISFDIKVHV